jgi:hypothetical protein
MSIGEVTMKKSLVALMIVGLVVLMAQMASAQDSKPQTLTLAVNSIYKLSLTGTPTLTVTTGTAGNPAFDAATGGGTYSWTQNSKDGGKITGKLSLAVGVTLPSGCVINVTLTPTADPAKGHSAGANDLALTLGSDAVSLVTSIPRGHDQGASIAYSFIVDATVVPSEVPSAATVTYTISD